MKGYAATEVFTARELELRDRAEGLVQLVDDEHGDIRCHELARAVHVALWPNGQVDEAWVVDGKLCAVEHSWLQLANPRHVLDVYMPGAVPMVQLVDLHWGLPWRSYQRSERRGDIDHDRVVDLVRQMAPTRSKRIGNNIVLTQPVGYCDGSGRVLNRRCPGCRACQ